MSCLLHRAASLSALDSVPFGLYCFAFFPRPCLVCFLFVHSFVRFFPHFSFFNHAFFAISGVFVCFVFRERFFLGFRKIDPITGR